MKWRGGGRGGGGVCNCGSKVQRLASQSDAVSHDGTRMALAKRRSTEICVGCCNEVVASPDMIHLYWLVMGFISPFFGFNEW